MSENGQTNLPKLSTFSREDVARATRVLDTEALVTSSTKLLAPELCQAIIARIDGEQQHCGEEDAAMLVALLLRCYPDFEPEKPYLAALHDTFMAYPPSLGMRVADAVKGLPSTLKYNPRIADVAEALRLQVKRRALVRSNAIWHMQEREARRKAAAAEAEFRIAFPDAETRQRQVDELLHARKMP